MRPLQQLFLAVVLFGLAFSPAAADELLSFKAGYQVLKPEGTFAVTGGGVKGTNVDFEGNLDFDDNKDYSLEAALQLGSFRLFGAYQPISFSGSGILSENLRFNGETFVGGSHIDSDVDLDIYEAGLAWYLVNVDDLPVRVQLGPELAVKYVNAHIEMAGTTTSGFARETETARVPVPTIGLRGRLALADFLGLVGRVGYVEYSGNSFLDVDAQVEFSPLPLVGIFAGYRYLDIDIDESNVLIDASFEGPHVGALIRF
jgi:hypothetical protein